MKMANIVQGMDIPLKDIVLLNSRDINLEKNKGYSKIHASIAAMGLIEPLCVYQEQDKYVLLDGFLRLKACEKLGIKTVPCLIYKDKEAYTFNRRVNRLSPVQEMRMLRKSLEKIDESTVAKVFGLKSIQYRLGAVQLKQLDKRIVKALDDNVISRLCANELSNVVPSRQLQIFDEMSRSNEYGVAFVRGLVIQTPDNQRNKDKHQRKPWSRNDAKKNDLVKKLQTVAHSYDLYAGTYRTYTNDLIKLCSFVRALITNERVKNHLQSKCPEILKSFSEIVLTPPGVGNN